MKLEKGLPTDLGVFIFRWQQVSDFGEDYGPHLRHQNDAGRRCEEVGQNLQLNKLFKMMYVYLFLQNFSNVNINL